MSLAVHGLTHTGRRRTNEDALLVDSALGLFVVADGMGGHNAGEVASAMAVAAIRDALAGSSAASEEELADAIRIANERVLNAATTQPDYAGMGTTVIAVRTDGDRALFGNVGDSRLYLWHAGALRQLTTDDSWLSRVLPEDAVSSAEALNHPMRHVLTKVVGLRDDLDPAVGSVQLTPDDVLLLCSDGLHGVITDEQIAAILARPIAVSEMTETLVHQALAAGGTDNITVIIARQE